MLVLGFTYPLRTRTQDHTCSGRDHEQELKTTQVVAETMNKNPRPHR